MAIESAPRWRPNPRRDGARIRAKMAPEIVRRWPRSARYSARNSARKALKRHTESARNSAATAPKTAFDHVTPGVLTAEGRIHFPLSVQFKTGNFETVQQHGSCVTDDHSKTTLETVRDSVLDIVLDATPRRLRKRRRNGTQNDFTR